MIKGRNGVFDVRLDDELVFSKDAVGRFPEPNEVESAVEEQLG